MLVVLSSVSIAASITQDGITITTYDNIKLGRQIELGNEIYNYLGIGGTVYIKVDYKGSDPLDLSVSIKTNDGKKLEIKDVSNAVPYRYTDKVLSRIDCINSTREYEANGTTIKDTIETCEKKFRDSSETRFKWTTLNTFNQKQHGIIEDILLIFDSRPRIRKTKYFNLKGRNWLSNSLYYKGQNTIYYKFNYNLTRGQEIKFDVVVTKSNGEQVILDPVFNSTLDESYTDEITTTYDYTTDTIYISNLTEAWATRVWTRTPNTNLPNYAYFTTGQYMEIWENTNTTRQPVEVENGNWNYTFNPTEVWDNSFNAVFHMNRINNQINDSTSQANDMTGLSGVFDVVNGLDYGIGFDGSGKGTTGTINLSNDMTLMVLMNVTSWADVGSEQCIIGNEATPTWYFSRHQSAGQHFNMGGDVLVYDAVGDAADSIHLYTITITNLGASREMIMHKDNIGVIANTSSTVTISQNVALQVGENCRATLTQSLTDASIWEILILNRSLNVDEVKRMYDAITNTSYSVYGELVLAPETPPTITINSPANITYIDNDVILNFTVTDDTSATMVCEYQLSGSPVNAIGNINNASTYQTTLTGLNHSTYSVNVTCSDDGGTNATEQINFTSLHYNVTNIEYLATDWETNLSTFNLTIEVASNINASSGVFVYNSTGYIATDTTNTTHFFYEREITIPLVEVNNTNRAFTFNITLNFTNGTIITIESASNNQAALWAYLIDTLVFPSTVNEGNPFTVLTNITKLIDNINLTNAITWQGIETASTQTSENATHAIYSTILTAPSIDATSTEYFNNTMTASLLATSRTNFTANSLSVVSLILDNCESGTNLIYNFTFGDENFRNFTNTETFSGVFTIWEDPDSKEVFIVNVTNSTHVNICTNSTDIKVNATIVYGEPDSEAQREYYLINNDTLDIVQNITLYNLGSDQTTLTNIFVKDAAGVAKVDVIVIVQRYYLELNEFITVAMARTDFQGLGNTKLVDTRTQLPNVFYRFILNDNSEILKTTSITKLVSDPVTGVITLTFNLRDNVGETYDIYNDGTVSCTNGTDTIVCNYNSNFISSTEITVSKIIGTNITTICTNTSTGTDGQINCTLGTDVNGTYLYNIKATYTNGLTAIIVSGTLTYLVPITFGITGLLIAVILISATSFIGSRSSPSVMIMGALAGFMFSNFIGFIILDFTLVIFISVIGLIGIYMVRD